MLTPVSRLTVGMHAMAERARARSNLCKQATTAHLKAQRLEEELQRTKAEAEEQVQCAKDEAAKEKKKLEAELEVKKTKVRDADGFPEGRL